PAPARCRRRRWREAAERQGRGVPMILPQGWSRTGMTRARIVGVIALLLPSSAVGAIAIPGAAVARLPARVSVGAERGAERGPERGDERGGRIMGYVRMKPS